QHVNTIVTFGAGLFKLVASALLIWRFGMIGVAVATALTEVGVCTWVSIELARASGGCGPSRQLARPFVVACAAGAAAFFGASLPPLAAVALLVALETAAVFLAGALPLRLDLEHAHVPDAVPVVGPE